MNLTIKNKLLGGFAVILLMLISTAFFMIIKFSESNDRFLKVVDISSRKVDLSNEISICVLDVARQEKNIILEIDQTRMLYFKDRIYKIQDSILKKTDELE